MSLSQLVGLAIVQGLTEFLPVSSSGHLILFSSVTGFQDQGMLTDIALHIGSLLAVLIYFRKEVSGILAGLWQARFLPASRIEGARLGYMVLVACLPALVCGFFLRNFGMDFLRNPKIIGWTILLYGLLLGAADKLGPKEKTLKDIGLKYALYIGLAQCLALIPGTSRSGITITMARFLGLTRVESAKFSMLLALPTIAAAGGLEAFRIYRNGDISLLASSLDAVLYSFAASFLVIYLMMAWLKKWSYLPFVVYRVILGTCVLLFAYGFL